MADEEKKGQQPDEKRDDMWYISGEYLSAATNMVACQVIDEYEADPDANREYEDMTTEELHEKLVYIMRQHCPVAYSYFYQNQTADGILPEGTVQIILQHVWMRQPSFRGGPNDGQPKIILPR